MKFYITILLVLTKLSILSQVIDYEHFDNKIMNKVLLETFNEFRRSRSLDTLVFSEVLYEEISKRNCLISSGKDSLFHPSAAKLWSGNGLRGRIAKESHKKLGGKVRMINGGDCIYINMRENAFCSSNRHYTYQEFAWRAIAAWERSPAHNESQNKVYASNGLPGMFSCHSEMSKSGRLFIFINFVEIFRD